MSARCLDARASVRAAAAVCSLVLLAACNIQFSNAAEAHDQWKRSYTLARPGTFELRDNSATIDVTTGEGNAVDVVADRTIGAATETAAKEALAQLEVGETVTPDRVAIDSSSLQSVLFGKSRKMVYHVRVPTWAAVTIDSTNGEVQVSGLGGPLRVSATNGKIHGTGLENGAKVTTTNGTTSLDFAKVGDADISCDTTNGAIVISVPDDAKARVSARVTNGSIRHDGLNLSIEEDSRRRLDASLGEGGPMISLSATNGSIRIQRRQ